MSSEVYIKAIELKGSTTAVIKSKWSQNEDEVGVEIFVKEWGAVFAGKFNQETVKSKKNVEFEAVKKSITLSEVQATNISYEMNQKRNQFSVVAPGNLNSSQESDAFDVDVIYLSFGVKKLAQDDIMPVLMQFAEDSLATQAKVSRLETALNERERDFKEIVGRNNNSKSTSQKDLDLAMETFHLLMDSMKKRIAELEKQLGKSANSSNKFANLSSDYDQSDRSETKAKAKASTPKRPPAKRATLSSQSSDDLSREPVPSTSKASHRSPAFGSNAGSRFNTPSGKKPLPKSSTPRGGISKLTPRKLELPDGLFEFNNVNNSDSDDDSNAKKPPRSHKPAINSSSLSDSFKGLKFRKQLSMQEEENQSSQELFTPRFRSSKRLHSSSSENGSQPATSGIQQLAQQEEFKQRKRGNGILSEANSKSSSLEMFSAQPQIYTQTLDQSMDSDEALSSQSPGIFNAPKGKKSKPKVLVKKPSKVQTRSKFSIDTEDVLADI